MKKISLITAAVLIMTMAAGIVLAEENRALWSKSTYIQSAKIIYMHEYRNQKNRETMYRCIDLLKEASTRFPRDPEIYFSLGAYYAEIGLLDTMVMNFDSVETICADSTIDPKIRSNCYKGKNNYTSGMVSIRQDYWEKAYASGAGNFQQYDTVVAMRDRAVTEDSVKLYDSLSKVAFSRCVDDFKQGIMLKPNDPRSYEALGMIQEREKQYLPAIENYKNTMRLTGENAKDVSRIAYAYITLAVEPNDSMSHWKDAIVWFERLVDLDPQNSSALINLSIGYNAMGDNEKFYEYAEKTLAVEPTNTQALSFTGQYWYAKMQAAAAELSEINDSTPGGEAKRKELDAKIIEYRDKSVAGFAKAVELNPEDKDAMRPLGILYLLSQQSDKAIDVFSRYLALDPNDASILDYLGRTYIQMGNFPDAIKPYEKLVENDRGNLEAWERLEELYRYTNQPDKADQAKATADELRKL